MGRAGCTAWSGSCSCSRRWSPTCSGARRFPRAARRSRLPSRRAWTRETLGEGVRAGDRRALARAISLVENSDPLAYEVVRDLYPETGTAYAVGITGPPGVGKSSLISALVRHLREQDRTIGVISVDPSSPFSHGALLGDRIRLADHFLDPGVFIRSMGTRGHLGGLAEATLQALLVLDAAGKELVFLETVGTGQSEIEVIGIVDTVLLVLMPGSGDSVQALKAGRARNLAGEVFSVASARAKQHLEHAVRDDPELERLLGAVQRRELDPLSAVREILEKVFHIGSDANETRTR